ncbi:hypothetical protein PF005_g12939 [Phytophthora fragariae]|uniref:RxLR effector protein n=1 Tax=Phytophthora fragariae TaxID=53985 RepID=A0A6A3S0Z0_9STRA|nr:hypothetical protein PF003_g15677 [Phytophthora fragariae]KAE8935927.1 hypothetical protein PF009_g14137 [Phytophthora fragariae]KAE8986549.1 hypothetical protein PF011_g19935 [Phytophthora fragariae]KAE9106628.1 hypothetical protein PF010_g12554 [Phytophthora fragariae]KAE9106907.1 hypothetical protein PF007_g13231 [Phytophthora fragariae]
MIRMSSVASFFLFAFSTTASMHCSCVSSRRGHRSISVFRARISFSSHVSGVAASCTVYE